MLLFFDHAVTDAACKSLQGNEWPCHLDKRAGPEKTLTDETAELHTPFIGRSLRNT